MMVETHLGPNTEVHQTHLNRLQGLEGNTPPNDPYFTPICYDRNGPNNTYIVMFGPISNTFFKGDETHSM